MKYPHLSGANISFLTPDVTPAETGQFNAAFMISMEVTNETASEVSHFQVTIPLPDMSRDTPFREVELRAAQLLPPALKSLADALEKKIATAETTEKS